MSEVQFLERTIKRPKESAEIYDALVELVKDIKAKKDITALVSENLAGLMKAVEGFDQLGAEAKAEGFYQSSGVFIGDMTDVLIKGDEVVES